ncbi:MAG: molecular chaperone TorD family protein [Rhodocyclaceae bacterium]|nr:molecular chaperone TorD family protein [Rhodocyclaceae bacterium]
MSEAPAAPNGSVAAISSPVAASSFLYGLLAECFAYPDDDLIESIRRGDLRRRIEQIASAVDAGLLGGLDLAPLHDPGAMLEPLAVEYSRLFDAGVRGTACSLNGGVHHGPQMKVMEEVVRYYNHFGLAMTDDNRELPDHLTAELGFLHFLAFGEQQLETAGRPVADYQRAQRDFIARHPGRWLPVMWRALEPLHAMPFFTLLTQLLLRLLTSEQARLEGLHGAADLKPSAAIPFGGI